MFQHQLRAPRRSDLPKMTDQLASASEPPIETFGDLLSHPRPPIALLERVKDFAKSSRFAQDGPLHPEVATLLYFAAIAVALVRCGARISELDSRALGQGF